MFLTIFIITKSFLRHIHTIFHSCKIAPKSLWSYIRFIVWTFLSSLLFNFLLLCCHKMFFFHSYPLLLADAETGFNRRPHTLCKYYSFWRSSQLEPIICTHDNYRALFTFRRVVLFLTHVLPKSASCCEML